jgi:hypothetical protein
LIGGFVDLIALHNLLNLLKTARAERRRHQRHRSGTLSRSHVFQTDSGSGDGAGGKIRPAFALLFVIESEHYLLPLLLIQC